MRRNHGIALIALIQTTLVAGLAFALRSKRIPLGVTGEWEWLRINAHLDVLAVILAGLSVIGYALYVCGGLRHTRTRGHARLWLVGLVPAAVMVQVGIQEGAPFGYGLVKSAVSLANPGSSGYYGVAKGQIGDLRTFLAAYPEWIKAQDALHVGTHPPGLFVVSWGLLRVMESHPDWARGIVGALPESFAVAFQTVSPSRPLPIADRASLAMTGLLTLLGCSATVVPLYIMARSRLPASASWVAAALWPVVPAALMFQPTGDTAFPLLSTSALALAAWSSRRPVLAICAGVLLGFGTDFTLAFFPVGLIAAIVYLTEPGVSWRRKAGLLLLTGAGFLAVTLGFWVLTTANPFMIWRTNTANHARFYEQFPRSYWAWVVENPVELSIALGLPTVVWGLAGFRSAPIVSWATIGTLIALTLSGKNLSEVARLWLPLMPSLLIVAGAAFDRLAARPLSLALTVALLGIQTLILQSMIQVVYPI
jgi:hypothetical protein